MKRTIWILAGIILLVCNKETVKAQESNAVFDTIFISGKGTTQQYKVAGTAISKVGLSGYSPQVVNGKSSVFGRDLGSNTYALLTGVGLGEKKDVDFVLPGFIKTDDSRLNWQMNFYCEGCIEKTRKRVRNDDGSIGNRIVDVKSIYWGRGATGFIIESSDTIGRYRMVFQPEISPALEEMLQEVNEEAFLISDSLFYLTWEYAIVGEFRGKESAVFYNSAVNKVYIIEESSLDGELLLESDLMNIKRKDQVELKLLAQGIIDKDKRNDLLRLAMLGVWMRTLTQ
jgi:hypothetical protein